MFAALLLLLLSGYYIPGANDPYRYRFNALLAVLARAAGVVPLGVEAPADEGAAAALLAAGAARVLPDLRVLKELLP